MTNTKTTKRALLTSVMALVLCFAMLLGTTFAWFTDSVTSGSNVIKTGNLDIEVEYTLDGTTWNDLDGADDLFQKGLWEPGHTEIVALKITNKGSLALKYTAKMNVTEEVIGKTKDGDDIVLSELLKVNTITMDAGPIGDALVGYYFSGENALTGNECYFNELNVLTTEEFLEAGASKYSIIKVDMPTSVGNEANHDGVNVPSIEFGINVLATQVTHEDDTFGNQYDKEATYDESWDALAQISWYNTEDNEFTLTNAYQLAGLAKLVNTGVDNFAGKTIKLGANMALNNVAWNPIGNSSTQFSGTFDGNGNTVNDLFIEGDNGYVGLFGRVAAGTKISNVKINNVVITDNDAEDNAVGVGAVVGYTSGAITLENVDVTGKIQISGDWYVSAVVGRSKGADFVNCSVVAADDSYVESGRWASGLSGYDNGAFTVTGCNVENLEVKAETYAGGLVALGAAGANVNGNTVKDVEVVLTDAVGVDNLMYGTAVGGVAIYSYSKAPITAYNNVYDNVICTYNDTVLANQEIGSKYADGTDQGLLMTSTVKKGNDYYTYLKLAFAAAAKDGTQVVIELTGDTMITAKFKPAVAAGQNIVLKTNGYKLLFVSADANKVPLTNADGSLVTTEVTAENMSSYITVKSGGTLVIE